MIENWNYVYKGIILCLCLQLLPISFVLIKQFSRRKKILGIFVLLLALAFSRHLFYTSITESTILASIYRYSLEVFFPPCIYLYIVLANKTDLGIFKHFIFPITYSLFFVILNLFSTNLISLNADLFSVIIPNTLSIYYLIYFVLGIKAFKNELDLRLKNKAIVKFKLFYYTIYIYELYNFLISAIISINLHWLKNPPIEFLENQTSQLIITLVSILLVLFLILYVLTELPLFREYYTGENLKKSKPLSLNQKVVKNNWIG